jgi:glycerol-3-phosphate dehydrogenase (NAD(P)+)
MGTACALLLARNPEHRVILWCPQVDRARLLAATRENERFLPGVKIPGPVEITADFKATAADAYVLAIPTVYLRDALQRLRPAWPTRGPIVSVIKGLERETFKRPSEIIAEFLPGSTVAALSGPSHAEEVARGMPASLVAASEIRGLAVDVQRWFSQERFRVYTSDDLIGTELAAALKNVIAVAAGICDGLGFGDNAKSALMTRGLVEMVRFGCSLGATEKTFYGLAGVGDVITTCVSRHGRNRELGERIGKGEKLDAILASTRKVFEGVWTASSVYHFALQRGISVPVTTEVYRILFEGKDPLTAAKDLMTRDLKHESGPWE